MADRRHADYIDIPGEFRMHRIIDVKSKRIVGSAQVTHLNGAAILWNIFVDPSMRRQKYATHLIMALKQVYRRIITSYYSDEGKALIMSCGFKIEVSPKSNIPQYVWEKGENNAGKSHQDGK